MPEPNFVNRSVWTGDNLDILRGINSECVDLIYTDPHRWITSFRSQGAGQTISATSSSSAEPATPKKSNRS